MFKMISVLRRDPSLSTQEFRDLYEGSYVPAAEKLLGQYATDYRRSYIDADLTDPRIPQVITDNSEFPWDSFTEVWYPDFDTYKASLEHSARVIASGNAPDVRALRNIMKAFSVSEFRSKF